MQETRSPRKFILNLLEATHKFFRNLLRTRLLDLEMLMILEGQ